MIMLSKWLFIFFQFLGVQNVFASHINNDIDVTKFMVFYNPDTQLQLKGTLENIGRYPFAGIGFHGLQCNCNNLTCGCCSGINITRFNINNHACTNFTYYPEETAIKLKFIINEKVLLSTGTLSVRNPVPICVPLYASIIKLCVRFYDVHISSKDVYTCINFEVLVETWPILILHFDCVKLGFDGITWAKPENNIQTAEMGLIMPEVNEPEIYDQVDFEPDLFEQSSNNHTSTSTVQNEEENNNIGQLKL